jgi:hypothetical protein
MDYHPTLDKPPGDETDLGQKDPAVLVAVAFEGARFASAVALLHFLTAQTRQSGAHNWKPIDTRESGYLLGGEGLAAGCRYQHQLIAARHHKMES